MMRWFEDNNEETAPMADDKKSIVASWTEHNHEDQHYAMLHLESEARECEKEARAATDEFRPLHERRIQALRAAIAVLEQASSAKSAELVPPPPILPPIQAHEPTVAPMVPPPVEDVILVRDATVEGEPRPRLPQNGAHAEVAQKPAVDPTVPTVRYRSAPHIRRPLKNGMTVMHRKTALMGPVTMIQGTRAFVDGKGPFKLDDLELLGDVPKEEVKLAPAPKSVEETK